MDALRDKNGLTEEEFLSQYRQKDYPRPSLTADIAVFAGDASEGDLRLLMVRRGGHPCLGCWALPGGFVGPDEYADTAAVRELEEETGVAGCVIEQLGVYSSPLRDPRGWTVSAAYIAKLDVQAIAIAADDAAEARWCPILVEPLSNGLTTMRIQAGADALHCTFKASPHSLMPARAQVSEAKGFAFDHAQIIADAWLALSNAGTRNRTSENFAETVYGTPNYRQQGYKH